MGQTYSGGTCFDAQRSLDMPVTDRMFNTNGCAGKRTHDFTSFTLLLSLQTAKKIISIHQKCVTILRKTHSPDCRKFPLYEQEIIGSDYFTYTQDYAAEWIPDLSVSNAINSASGKVVNVQLGVGNERKLLLKVYLRMKTVNGKFIASPMRAIISNSIFLTTGRLLPHTRASITSP
jgi:hypothetical protein